MQDFYQEILTDEYVRSRKKAVKQEKDSAKAAGAFERSLKGGMI